MWQSEVQMHCPITYQTGSKKICISSECEVENPFICDECQQIHEHNGTILAIRVNKILELKDKIQNKKKFLRQAITQQKQIINILEQKLKTQIDEKDQECQILEGVMDKIEKVLQGKLKGFGNVWQKIKNVVKNNEDFHEITEMNERMNKIKQILQGGSVHERELGLQSKVEIIPDVFSQKICEIYEMLPIQLSRPAQDSLLDKIASLPKTVYFQNVAQARLYELTDQNEKALEIYNKILEQNVFDGKILSQRANLLRNLQKYEQAYDDYTQLMDLTAGQLNSQNYIFNRGEVSRALGNLNSAIKDYEVYLNKNKDDSLGAHEILGEVFLKDGKKEKAVEHFEKFLVGHRKDHEIIKVTSILMKLCKENNNDGKMLQYLNTYLKVVPDSLQHIIDRGALNLKLQNFDQAHKDYTAALRQVPSNPGLYYNRGLCSLKQHNLDAALEDFTISIKQDPEFKEAYLTLGNIYLQLTQKPNLPPQNLTKFKKMALHYYAKIITYYPTSHTLWYNLATLYVEFSEQQAIQCYSKAIQHKPDYIEAILGRMKLYLKSKGKEQEALADSRKLVSCGVGGVHLLYVKGLLESQLGLNEEALQTMTKVLEKDNKKIEAREIRAKLYKLLQEEKQCRQDIQLLQQMDPARSAEFEGILNS